MGIRQEKKGVDAILKFYKRRLVTFVKLENGVNLYADWIDCTTRLAHQQIVQCHIPNQLPITDRCS